MPVLTTAGKLASSDVLAAARWLPGEGGGCGGGDAGNVVVFIVVVLVKIDDVLLFV
jgi:hypothetical protein